MLKYSIPITLILLLSAGCKKESLAPPASPDTSTTALMAGLPADPDSTHGYFFAGYSYLRDGSSDTQGITCFAEFADPATDFVSHIDRRDHYKVRMSEFHANVGMGTVRYNGTSLTGSSGYYQLDDGPPSSIDQQARWEVGGNIVISGFAEELKNEFPILNDTTRTLSIHANQGFTLAPSDYFDRWDSVVVKIISYANYYSTYSVDKAGGKGVSSLVFTSKQLDFLPDHNSGALLVRGFRYFHRTIQGRRYVYELSTGALYRAQVSR